MEVILELCVRSLDTCNNNIFTIIAKMGMGNQIKEQPVIGAWCLITQQSRAGINVRRAGKHGGQIARLIS